MYGILNKTRRLVVLTWLVSCPFTACAQESSDGYWSSSQSEQILKQTLPVSIAADLSALGERERLAVDKLLEVGQLMHELYLQQRHAEALATVDRIKMLAEPRRTQMGRLFHLFKGPIATTLDNRRVPFVPVANEVPTPAWVTGKFKNLNAQIGSYETYDDALYGVKAFYGLSMLVRDARRSAELAAAIKDIQKIEDALPYDDHKRVREDIPVGVYNVIADFGQARGTNTATILPNEALHARRYGRTILLRYNIHDASRAV